MADLLCCTKLWGGAAAELPASQKPTLAGQVAPAWQCCHQVTCETSSMVRGISRNETRTLCCLQMGYMRVKAQFVSNWEDLVWGLLCSLPAWESFCAFWQIFVLFVFKYNLRLSPTLPIIWFLLLIVISSFVLDNGFKDITVSFVFV